MKFEFATANRIIFGPGALQEAGALVRSMGSRALVVTGKEANRSLLLRKQLRDADVASGSFPVEGEPTVSIAQQAAAFAAREQCDIIIGFGGGSAIDVAKTVAVLVANGGKLLDYLEIIGRNLPLTKPALPCVAIPTTAGTGAEVTRNAVLISPAHKAKVSLRSPFLLPRLAIVDPLLTFSSPQTVTAYSGMDALTQLIEPFTSIRANPMTDGLCREGLSRVARSLCTAYHDGTNASAREEMSLGSLFGGLALTHAGLGTVHGIAGAIGGMFKAPHGAVCAALLPHVMRINQAALRARQPNSDALLRYQEIAGLFTGRPDASPEDGADSINDMIKDLGIPPLGAHGILPDDFHAITEKALAANSTKSNPIPLLPKEINEILELACQ